MCFKELIYFEACCGNPNDCYQINISFYTSLELSYREKLTLFIETGCVTENLKCGFLVRFSITTYLECKRKCCRMSEILLSVPEIVTFNSFLLNGENKKSLEDLLVSFLLALGFEGFFCVMG